MASRSEKKPLLVNASQSSHQVDQVAPTGDPKPSYAVAALVSIGNIFVGFSMGFTSPATQQLSVKNGSEPHAHGDSLAFNEEQIGWFGSAIFLGALIGGLLGGFLAGKIGRKPSLMAGNALFVCGWILVACGKSLAALVAGRAITGLAVGVLVLVNPIYLAETVLPNLRGALTSVLQLSVAVGIVLSFSAGTAMTYRALAIMGACMSGAFALVLFLVPETPRWYFRNGKTEKGMAALKKLRGACAHVEAELNQIQERISAEMREPEFSFSEFRTERIYRPLLISIALMLFQVWSGSFAVTAYAAIIFDNAGLSDKATTVSIGLSLVQFTFTAGSMFIIDRNGRRPLLMAAGAGMSLACIAMSLFYFYSDRIHGTGAIAMPILAIYVYSAAYSLGLGAIPWLFMAEAFPGRARAVLSSISASSNWLNAFLNTRYFAEMVMAMTNAGMFLFLAVVCLLLVVFTHFVVPETKGKTLEQIEQIFDSKQARSERPLQSQ